jgi:hypothetical protein
LGSPNDKVAFGEFPMSQWGCELHNMKTTKVDFPKRESQIGKMGEATAFPYPYTWYRFQNSKELFHHGYSYGMTALDTPHAQLPHGHVCGSPSMV